MTAESSSKAAAAAESAAPPARWTRRLRRVPLRLVLVVAALFTALTVLGGGAGLVLGKVASVGTEHRHHGSTLHEDDGDGAGPFPRGPNGELSR
ncbi:MAG: hypothetical protein WCB73_01820 [Pseudonocardiaceae bacterium]